MRSDLTRIQQIRRDDILAAAVEAFGTERSEDVSIAGIAVRAGTSKGTVLYHFGSRAALQEAVVVDLFERGWNFMADRMRGIDEPAELLYAYLDSNLRFIVERPTHVIAVHRILEGVTLPDQAPDAIEQLAEILRDGQQRHRFGAFDPVVVAKLIRAIIDAASYHLTEAADLDIDHHLDEAIAFVERAVGSRRRHNSPQSKDPS
ncbi:TetR/AcrR family transcriptional regulator [Microbacterium gorillae]|uniref:TetR/AcrR family transcriptional regulator n=1 Tax=Microbacterium gorillae TaxID=1231063 RepID=UPI000694B98F|nr:TetR/AcrR family transcriptional regulator [Microbacterium gorillae]